MEGQQKVQFGSSMKEFEICKRHQKVERVSEKFFKNAYVCVNRFCVNSFELACVKCRMELHKDHASKFITLETFKNGIFNLSKKSHKPSYEPYEMYKKQKFIKEFRRRMQIIEADMNLAVSRMIKWSEALEIQEVRNYGQLQQFVESFSTFLQDSPTFVEKCKNIGKFLDFNTKRETMEMSSTRIKQCQYERKKQIDTVRKQIEEIKEYTMKIIEVLLHHAETDEEQELAVTKKRIAVMREDALNMDKQQIKLLKQSILELVEDIDSRNEELGKWIRKTEGVDQLGYIDFGTSNYAKDTMALSRLNQLEKEKAEMTAQIEEKTSLVEDLKKKISRMNDKLTEKKKSTQVEESKDVGRMKQDIEHLQKKLTSTESQAYSLAGHVRDLQESLRQAELQNRLLADRNEDLDKKLNEKQTIKITQQIKVLQAKIASLEEQQKQQKQQLETAQENLQKERDKSANLSKLYSGLDQRLSSIISRTHNANEKLKTIDQSKIETIQRLTQRCRDVIMKAKRSVPSE